MFLLAKEEEVVDIMISKDLIIEVADELVMRISQTVEYYPRHSNRQFSRVGEWLHSCNSLSG